ncbi:MAG: phosphoribosylaminoimidazolesuccinocarboxamide synthase [Candidatus Diapherotrites archaeon]
MGSVKDLSVIKKPSEKEMGLGVFSFTDDYSVFDYGKMPDVIPFKGEALCRMAAFNFEELEKRGVKSHYRKLLKGNEMEVNLVQVLRPQKNELKDSSSNYLVPLEIIFRNSLPEGSSVFKRIAKGELNFKDLGLKEMPKPGEKLEKPLLDVSTKLEETDRYLSWSEAQSLARLKEKELNELKEKTFLINGFLTEKAEEIGLEHADGKVEFALSPKRELMLVDVVGTLDENRMLFNGMHISKQVLRDYYLKTEWYKKIEEAKAKRLPKEEWPAPQRLSKELVEIVSNMYKSVTEEWCNKKFWEETPSIGEAVEEYKQFLDGR